MNFSIPTLPHNEGYIISIESRHAKGRQLLFSVINQTAKHSELETFLSSDTEWNTSYFIIPPLAFDGLGYTFYFSNDSLAGIESINELQRIRIYKFPYSELVKMKAGNAKPSHVTSVNYVYHPNSSYYFVKTLRQDESLILYQSFHPGWRAYEVDSGLASIFPFLFGKQIGNHVLINNWANGWELPTGDSVDERKIVIYFLPQLLQWFGFLLLPLPFVALGIVWLKQNKKTRRISVHQ